MSDGTVDLNNRTKAAMRQEETFLNKSGKVVPKTITTSSTQGSVTKLPESLGIHGQPYKDRRPRE